MNFGQAFSYVFKDPDWFKKVAIAGLISIIPVLGQLYLLGWSLEITRRVINGEENPLIPDTDFGGFLGRGFKAVIVSLVYSLPLILFSIPIGVASGGLASADIDENTLGIIISAISICCGGLMFIYSLLMAFMLPAAFANFVHKGNISDGLRFSEVLGIVKAAPVAYLLVVVGTIAASFIGSLGSIACAIGVLLTYAYAMLIMGHFYGQAYNQARLAKQL